MDLKELEKDVQAFTGKLGKVDHYVLLGVERTATTREIKRTFLGYARKFHPDQYESMDLGALAAQMQEVLAQLSLAQSVLTNPQKRAAYDANHPVGKKVERQTDVSQIFEADKAFRAAKRLVDRDEYERAIKELHRANSLNGGESEYDAYIAWCDYNLLTEQDKKKNSTVDGIKARINAVIEEYPKNDAALVFLAHIERSQGRRKAALKHYTEALDINPHNNVARSHVRIMTLRNSKKNKVGFFAKLFGKK